MSLTPLTRLALKLGICLVLITLAGVADAGIISVPTGGWGILGSRFP